MARVARPSALQLDPFFVLRWDADMEQMVIYVEVDGKPESYELGDYMPGASRQLQLWGVDPFFADRAIDTAREFRAVQVIQSQDRIIPLHKREAAGRLVADALAESERPEGSNGYANL